MWYYLTLPYTYTPYKILLKQKLVLIAKLSMFFFTQSERERFPIQKLLRLSFPYRHKKDCSRIKGSFNNYVTAKDWVDVAAGFMPVV